MVDEHRESNRPPWVIIIVKVIGFGIIAIALTMFIQSIIEGTSISILAVGGVCSAVFLGTMLILKRQSGCILFLGIMGVYVLISIMTALGYGMGSDLFWIGPEYDWIIDCACWVLGTFVFVKNRKHFI